MAIISPATATRPARAGKKEWIGLAVIALPCLLYSMDLTVLNLALPALSADLKPTGAQLLWMVDIYGFLVAGSLITMGTLGDRIGRRKLLMIGAAAFGLASVAAAFASSAEMLIATRALLGIAGATLAPSTLSLIRNMFHDPGQRTFAIGIWAMSYSVGGAIGPLLGGIMLEHFAWGSVFLIGVPVMILLLALAPVLLPEFRNPEAERLDLVSAALSLVSVLAIIYTLKQFAHDGAGWPAAATLACGVLTGALFLRRQRGLNDPFIDLKLFENRSFNAALVLYTLSILVAFGSFFFIAQYLQLVMGLSPLEAGLWSLPSSAGFVVGSMLAPAFTRFQKTSYVIAGGLVMAAIGFGFLYFIAEGGLAFLVIGSVLNSLGFSPAVIHATDLIVGSAPPARSGSAASISETSAEFGGASGIALLGSAGTVVYRSSLSEAKLDALPPAAQGQTVETLGGAMEVARQLPAGQRDMLVNAAQQAFGDAFEVNALISALIALGVALVAILFLKNIQTAKG